jgi:hypothetical protein
MTVRVGDYAAPPTMREVAVPSDVIVSPGAVAAALGPMTRAEIRDRLATLIAARLDQLVRDPDARRAFIIKGNAQ